MPKEKLLEIQAQFFKALGQPIRLQIVYLLKEGERCVSQIFPVIRQEQATVSKHLSILKQAGIIDSRKEGLRIIYRVKDPNVFKLLEGVSGVLKSQMKRKHSLWDQ